MNLDCIENPYKYLRNLLNGSGMHVHHITPRCLGGNDDWCNLSILTLEQHKEIHREIAKQHPKLIVASNFMSGKTEQAFSLLRSIAGKTGGAIGGKKVGRRMHTENRGIFGMNPEDSRERNRKGGSISGKLLWWTNGTNNIRSNEQPTGYARGVTRLKALQPGE